MSAHLAELATAGRRMAIDTEFMSERRYQAVLCLAQVAVPDPGSPEGVITEVLDPLGELDPAPIAAALADPAVRVFVHAGRQDVAILRRTWCTEVTSVFDTQVAAGFLGFGSQEGYESLVRKVLKQELRGSEGFTHWDRRPLTEAQLAYARDDARLLLALGAELERRLSEAGRLEWAREECRAVESASDERDPQSAYERLPRVGRLEPVQRAVALELSVWREETGRAIDRPPALVLPDHALVEVARRMPSDQDALERVRGLPQQTLHRRGRELLEAVARGRRATPPPSPPSPPVRRSEEAPLVALAQALVRHRALESRIATELIATQAELAALVSAIRRGLDGDVRVTEGWRAQLVGSELRELLAGRRALRVGPGGRLDVSS